MDFIEKCIFLKYTCIKFVYMYNGHPLFKLLQPPLPALKWQLWKFTYRKNVEFNCSYMYISEAENMAL